MPSLRRNFNTSPVSAILLAPGTSQGGQRDGQANFAGFSDCPFPGPRPEVRLALRSRGESARVAEALNGSRECAWGSNIPSSAYDMQNRTMEETEPGHLNSFEGPSMGTSQMRKSMGFELTGTLVRATVGIGNYCCCGVSVTPGRGPRWISYRPEKRACSKGGLREGPAPCIARK